MPTPLFIAIFACSLASAEFSEGKRLFVELNCAGCHPSPNVAQTKGPILGRDGAKLTPDFVRAFLTDPHAQKPGTTMPNIVHGVPDKAVASAVEALTHFLLRNQTADTNPSAFPIDFDLKTLAKIRPPIFTPMAPPGFIADERLADRGEQLFNNMNCSACHQIADTPAYVLNAKPLSELNLNEGCLADEVPIGIPDYQLAAEQRTQLRNFLEKPIPRADR